MKQKAKHRFDQNEDVHSRPSSSYDWNPLTMRWGQSTTVKGQNHRVWCMFLSVRKLWGDGTKRSLFLQWNVYFFLISSL